jgi:arabinogalactan oligomer/maltooligosaccharide transport system substrate-binding protein
VIDEEKKSLAIDTPEAVAAAAAVREIVARHGILPTGMSGFVITAMFSDGKVPFVFNGPWFIAEIGQGVEWGVAPLPTADNGQPLKPFLGSEAVLLSKETRVREEALQVMDFLTSDEAALTRVKAGRQMVANAAVYANPSVAADPVVKVFRAQADNAVPMSNLAEAGVAWQPYSNALRKVVFGGENPAVALKEVAAKATAAMEKLRK